ncbi:unnamed protein product [Rotaria sordida]|uniref:Rootletin-like coiled-coil domain-containing protein n=1 Tax=Rotaria sordida TaxID=392033 RepID=A0A815U0N1_9BILA|nr:unnamed protein product [Rotaria sordida]
MVDDNILEATIHLEVISHDDDDDDDDNRNTPTRGQIHDIILNRVQTSPLTRSRSPFTVSSQSSSRNIMTTPNSTQLMDENRFLNDELNRVETILNLTRTEKDELSIRYNALSDRLEESLRAQGIDISSDSNNGEPERRILVQQNIDLRRKLEEEHQNYKRKLSNYQEGQLKQAQLVQKLQQKVLQYKNRCSELELLMEQHKNGMERIRLTSASNATSSSIYELRTTQTNDEENIAIITLEEEKHKSANLMQLNTMLREQLDQAHLTNQQLNDDLRRTIVELQKLRENFTQQTHDWKQEERVFNQFYNKEHNFMYELWRDIVSFRKQFIELKGSTERDLTRVRNDLAQTERSLTSACFGFLTVAKTAETQGQATSERERHDRTSLESQIRDKTREISDLQQRLQEISLLNEKLRFQLAEKDGTIMTLTRANQIQHQATYRFSNITIMQHQGLYP